MAKDLSKVKKIEIEVFSRCNRKCNWCPNVAFDRFSKDIPMGEECYLNLLNDLKKANFTGHISFSRYNEPTQNHVLLKKRINQARKVFPKSTFSANTNGDYLRKGWVKGELLGIEILDGLDLDELHIMDYDCRGLDYGKELFQRLNITQIPTKNLPPKYQLKWKLIGKTKDVKLVHFYADWPKHNPIENRGGFFTDLATGKLKDITANYGDKETRGTILKWKNGGAKRTEPCLLPTINMNIDYDGTVNPCCHIRTDNPRHKDFHLGNINEEGVNEIYHSKKATDFRNLLASGDHKNYPEPCRLCTKGG